MTVQGTFPVLMIRELESTQPVSVVVPMETKGPFLRGTVLLSKFRPAPPAKLHESLLLDRLAQSTADRHRFGGWFGRGAPGRVARVASFERGTTSHGP